jgi:stage V sporulation protein S
MIESITTHESIHSTNGNGPKTLNIIKVSARSRTAAVAGAIAGVMRESSHAEVQAIGAGAVNQAVKAIVIAKGYLAEEDVHIVCVPSFVDVDIDDQERTAIRFVIEPQR